MLGLSSYVGSADISLGFRFRRVEGSLEVLRWDDRSKVMRWRDTQRASDKILSSRSGQLREVSPEGHKAGSDLAVKNVDVLGQEGRG